MKKAAEFKTLTMDEPQFLEFLKQDRFELSTPEEDEYRERVVMKEKKRNRRL